MRTYLGFCFLAWTLGAAVGLVALSPGRERPLRAFWLAAAVSFCAAVELALLGTP